MNKDLTGELGFKRIELGRDHCLYSGFLPENLLADTRQFETLWQLHPAERAIVIMHGRPVRIPRWQQAYNIDYGFSGNKAIAKPAPAFFQSYLVWAQEQIEPSLNGILVNWYDGNLKHYIGPHHDETKQLIEGTPIVTVSLREERIFRMTLEGNKGGKKSVLETVDTLVKPGSVVVIPWETNLIWKHSVPFFARYKERRISITLRAFENRNLS